MQLIFSIINSEAVTKTFEKINMKIIRFFVDKR